MKTFNREFPRAVLLSIVIFIIIQLITVMSGGSIVFDQQLLISYMFTAMYTGLLYLANTLIFIYLDKKFTNRFSKPRLFFGFVLTFLSALIVVFFMHFFEKVILEKQTFDYFLANEKPIDYLFTVVVTIITTLSLYSIY